MVRYLNGLGLVASGKRNIADGAQYDRYFPKPRYSDPFLSYSGDTTQTINFMADIIKNTLADTKQIAQLLKAKMLTQTSKNIFDFIFRHIQYTPDNPTREELRRPSRAWADRKSGVDCDCYSIFIGSILSNLKIPYALRMVKIDGKSHFQHVYVVVPKNGKESGLKSGQYFTIDPVLDTYNEEHPFTGKFDLFMQPIQYLNGLSGAPSASIGGYFSQEAASDPNAQVFHDGEHYYVRDMGMTGGLNGLSGLGFLKKLISIGSKVADKLKNSKIVKKIAKPLMYKKDGTKRAVFQKMADNKVARQEKKAAAEQQEIAAAQQEAMASRVNVVPSASTQAATNVTSALNQLKENAVAAVKDAIPDLSAITNTVKQDAQAVVAQMEKETANIKELVDAKVKAETVDKTEVREIAKQTAEAQKAEILKDVIDLQQNKVTQAGFGGMNLQTMMMIGLGLALVVPRLLPSKTA